jgi:outer membrane protein OmpA-like peptidoglycan-associated protein
MTMFRFAPVLPLAALVFGGAVPAFAVDIQPHRALYSLTLGSAKSASGVVGAGGAMTYEWGETCGGWTVEQRFRLRLEYTDQDAAEITSNLVTWESKSGDRYRFNERRMRNGALDEEIRGEAHLNVPQSYMLGFDPGSAKLTANARATIEQAADASRKAPNYHVLVVGHGGPPKPSANGGAKAEDDHLSKQRAEAARAELIRAGVPATAVKIATGASESSPISVIQDTQDKAAPERPVEIVLEPTERGGVAEFTKPEQATIPLKPEVLFPTAHTVFLIERAQAGDPFVVRYVFDGTSVDDATMISAVIGKTLKPGEHAVKSPILERPSWQMRLAFFPAESKSEEPDYELSMRVLDNGVSEDMALDYGDYVVKAALEKIEPLSKPAC